MAEKRASLIIELKDTATAALHNFESGIQKLKSSVVEAGAAFVTFSAFVYKSVAAYGEAEVASLRLSTALKNSGDATGKASAQLEQLANSLSKLTGFDNTAIVSMQALLATLGFGPKAIEVLTPRVLDLARATGTDLHQAAMSLGKAIEFGSTMPLRRMGITIDETALKNRDFSAIIGQLDSKLKGIAITFGDTGTGGIAKLRSSVNQLTETFGKSLTEALNPFVQWGTRVVQTIETLDPRFFKFVATAVLSATAITGLAAALGAVAFIGAPVIATVLGISVGVALLGTNLFGLRTLVVDVLNVIVSGFSAMHLAVTGKMQEASKVSTEALKKLKTDAADTYTSMKTGATEAYESIKKIFSQGFGKEKGSSKGPTPGAPSGVPSTEIPIAGIPTKEQIEAKILELQGYHARVQELELKQQAHLLSQARRTSESQRLMEAFYWKITLDGASKFFGDLSGLQKSKSSEMAAIGKTAAIAQTTIDTYRSATQAYAAMSGIPIVGPALGAAAAAAAIVAGLENVSRIQGVALAEGGIVLPTSGGTIARIGEGGKSEAVIPLDDPRAKQKMSGMLGNNITIQAGTIVANDYSVVEFARRIDQELFKLGRNRKSVAI